METFIVAEGIDAATLKLLLEQELDGQVELTLQDEPENTMALDPQVLIALLGLGGSSVLGAVVNGLFSIWKNKQDSFVKVAEQKATVAVAMARIKTPEGLEIEVPQGIAPELLAQLLEPLKNSPIKSIAVLEAE
jgi:hypothetical protein